MYRAFPVTQSEQEMLQMGEDPLFDILIELLFRSFIIISHR